MYFFFFQAEDGIRDASDMAAAAMNMSRLPVARPASVDAEFGSTLTVQHVKVSGPQYFVAGSYLSVGSTTVAGQAPPQYAAPDITLAGEFYGNTQTNRLIVSERSIAPSGFCTAAT